MLRKAILNVFVGVKSKSLEVIIQETKSLKQWKVNTRSKIINKTHIKQRHFSDIFTFTLLRKLIIM